MKDKVIVFINTVSVQTYIFRSNKLKENIGASYLVKYVLEDGLLKQIKELDASAWLSLLDKKYKKSASTFGEVLYLAGGNAVLIFDSKEIAKENIYKWSKWLLKKAPGLKTSITISKIEDNNISKTFKNTIDKFGRHLSMPSTNIPLLALPINRSCVSTGLPANKYYKKDKSYLSNEAFKKRQAAEEDEGSAQAQIYNDFREILKNNLSFPLDLSELGGKKGEARIAVVHIDGNEIGKKIRDICEKFSRDTDFISTIREFSVQLKKISHECFLRTLIKLKENITNLKDKLSIKDSYLPIRPLVYGGDDLTFVCDARIGLPLTQIYLEEFSTQKITLPTKKINLDLSAAAGVALVPAKFPFHRAYRLAEELCASAKRKRINSHKGGSWIDFQSVFSGAESSLEQMRETRFKTLSNDSLLWRPWSIDIGDIKWNDCVEAAQQLKSWPNSVVKELKVALSQGKSATQRWIEYQKSRGRKLPSFQNQQLQKTGWRGSKTPYFDVIEIMECYEPIL